MANQKLFSVMMCMCFGYSVIDVLLMREDDCMMSMQRWLVLSYVNLAIFRGSQKLGQHYSPKGEDFIFSFRHESLLPRLVVIFTWCFLVPWFAAWTVIGTLNIRSVMQLQTCSTQGTSPELIMFWQLLSYVWICIYVVYFGIACVIEYRLRMAERNMRLIENDESRARWGHIAPAVSDSMAALSAQTGLQPHEIQALPMIVAQEEQAASSEMHCPICLSDFCAGDKIRGLPKCGHYFHQSCIDLWLLRRADCPMCKSAVQ